MASMKDHYNTDADFKEVWESLHNNPSIAVADYTLIDEYWRRVVRFVFLKDLYKSLLFRNYMEEEWQVILGKTRHFLVADRFY